MINPSQLRIGNLFYPINRNGKVHLPYDVAFIITEVALNEVKSYLLGKPLHQVVKYDTSSIRDISPIPLTEEWLVRFGLKLKPNHTAFHIKGMQFEIPSMIGGYYDNEYGLDQETVIELKHVHQLQNLYFALTGEELTIKL